MVRTQTAKGGNKWKILRMERSRKWGTSRIDIRASAFYTIYINDIGNGLNNSILKFTDDTKLWEKVNNNEDVVSMKEDLNELSKWSKDNEMPFNVSKCCVMHVGKKNATEVYKIDGQVIEEVKEIKDLGVFSQKGVNQQ